MPVFTLSELRDQVRTLGDYPASSDVMTDAFVDDSINKALGELFKLVTDAFEGYYTVTGTLTTTADADTVDLPADFYSLRALDRDMGGNVFRPLRRVTLADTYRMGGSGTPRGYMLHGGTAPGTARLWPVPDGVYDLRITYDPLFTPLVDDEDEFDFRNGWEDYVIAAALFRLDEREQRQLGDRLAAIDRIEKRIRSEAPKRDSAGPEYLGGSGGTCYTEEWD